LYDRLFASFVGDAPPDPRLGLRVDVVDAVREDAQRLKRRLGVQDQQRVDAHLNSLWELREQLRAEAPEATAQCFKPERPTQGNADVSSREPIKAVNDAMNKLIAMAFACDLTRIVAVHFSSASGYTSLPDIGTTTDVHSLTHDGGAQDKVHDAIVYTLQRAADLATGLLAVPEGAGNVLDQTAMLVTSDTSEGLDHTVSDYPLILLGRGGGALKYPGVHDRQAGANASNVLLTLLKTVDPTITSVGAGAGASTTPCTGVMA
jgi:hypothetical protein